MMNVIIQPIREEDAVGFHQVYDFVARERKYLSATEGPPLERTREFISRNIANGYPQFVAVSAGEVAGWCDIIPMSLPTHRHAGTLVA
jgi:L-amino acid N-acyltransferase YncA